MKHIIIICIVLVAVVLSGCTDDPGFPSPEEAMAGAGIQSKGILKQIELQDAALIFYQKKEPVKDVHVGAGLVRKMNGSWTWMNGSEVQRLTEAPVTYRWTNLDKMNQAGSGYHMYWGIVNQENIAKLHIKQRKGWGTDADAELLDTGLGYRIWYLVLDEYYGTVPGVDMIGYSAGGEVVYKYE
ncbi:hypothetical protein [Paenibacillus sp. GCM10012303]|uniref:hypothetical protein n=1 Tax=Paenibacillus sp. GCM10012303 TaxID=3317340 RepID=UPI00360B2869